LFLTACQFHFACELLGLRLPDPALNQAAGGGRFGLDLVGNFLFQRPGAFGFIAALWKFDAAKQYKGKRDMPVNWAKKEFKDLGKITALGESVRGPQYRTICRSLVVDPTDGSVYFTTSEGTIFLNVDVENTTPDWSTTVNGNPSLLTQQATTQVLVTDGGTVVIGGVIQTSNTTNVQQVPLLGNIPMLGNLFKRRTVSSSTQELIFFITPRIVQI